MFVARHAARSLLVDALIKSVPRHAGSKLPDAHASFATPKLPLK
jgi:hypothetical protein